MVTIEIKNGNICQLDGDRKALMKLCDLFRVKHPNAWHILMYQKGKTRWDGFIKYISDAGRFRIGLLPKVYEEATKMGQRVKIIDERAKLPEPVIPDTLGDKTLYPRQKQALEKILFHKIGGIPFHVCAGDLAVGFGKSLLFSAIHKAYNNKLKTILLLNDSDLFNQFKREIPPMLPGIDVRFIQGAKAEFGDFNVAMVQSISRNLKKYQWELAKIEICLIDEADIIDNKTYKGVIEHLYNTRVRVGLSGTLYMSKLKKDQVHNLNIMSFIGDKVDTVKLIDQMKAGRATPVVVKMIDTNLEDKGQINYPDEYAATITNNEEAYCESFDRALYNAKYHRFPMLIVTKFIDHCEQLYEFYQERSKSLGLKWNIAFVHHETKDRNRILEDFRLGKIDVLIATTIISRGKNFPALRYLQNTASMDSNEKAIQILGRLVRQSEGKDKAYLDDLMFPGHYLTRHAKHRKAYYKKEKLKVLVVPSKVKLKITNKVNK